MEITKEIETKIKNIFENKVLMQHGLRKLSGGFVEIINYKIDDNPKHCMLFISGEYKYGIQNDVEDRVNKEKFEFVAISYIEIQK